MCMSHYYAKRNQAKFKRKDLPPLFCYVISLDKRKIIPITKLTAYFFVQWKIATTNNFHDQAFTVTVHKGILLNLQLPLMLHLILWFLCNLQFLMKVPGNVGKLMELMVWHCYRSHGHAGWWYLVYLLWICACLVLSCDKLDTEDVPTFSISGCCTVQSFKEQIKHTPH